MFHPKAFYFRAFGIKGRTVNVLLVLMFFPSCCNILYSVCYVVTRKCDNNRDSIGLIRISVKLGHLFEIRHVDWNWKAIQKPETIIFKIQDSNLKVDNQPFK